MAGIIIAIRRDGCIGEGMITGITWTGDTFNVLITATPSITTGTDTMVEEDSKVKSQN